MRDLIAVIDQMIVATDPLAPLTIELERLRGSAQYTPSWCMDQCWGQVARTLAEHIGPPRGKGGTPGLEPGNDWGIVVERIWLEAIANAD